MISKACIVVTNFNGREKGFLNPFLDTVDLNLMKLDKEKLDIKTIIVDDGSKDGSLKVLHRFKDSHKDLVDILQTQNREAVATLNHGIRHALQEYPGYRYIVTFDIDTCMSESFLRTIIKKADNSRQNVGMIASNEFLLTYFPTERVHRSTGHFVSASGATLDRDFLDKGSSRGKVILCPCFSGALFKTKLFCDIALVPEDYIHYNNCSEFGFRAQANGWKVDYEERAVMWHNYRRQYQIPDRLKDNRELSRIWNILRFFPEKKIGLALEAYKKEAFITSPSLKEKKLYIQRAKMNPPVVNPSIPRDKKREIYKKFITANF